MAGKTKVCSVGFPHSTPPWREEIGAADRSISVTEVNRLRLEAGVRVGPREESVRLEPPPFCFSSMLKLVGLLGSPPPTPLKTAGFTTWAWSCDNVTFSSPTISLKASEPTDCRFSSAVKSIVVNWVPAKADAPIVVIVWPPSKARVLEDDEA